MDMLSGALFFILGTLIGRFLNMGISRSVCRAADDDAFNEDACAVRFVAADFIQPSSFQKCCRSRAALRRAAVPLLNGTLYLLLLLRFGLVWELPAYAALFSLLIVASVVDIHIMEIPDAVVIAGFVAGGLQLTAAVFTGALDAWYSYAIGLAAGGLPLLLVSLAGSLFGKETMGGGDIKLMAFCGFITGWRLMIPAYLIGITAGAMGGAALMALGRKKHGDAIPFGPFLSLGVVISVFFGDALMDWYLGLI